MSIFERQNQRGIGLQLTLKACLKIYRLQTLILLRLAIAKKNERMRNLADYNSRFCTGQSNNKLLILNGHLGTLMDKAKEVDVFSN